MKLQQGQIWMRDGIFFRIVHLERLEVEFKELTDLIKRDGTHHHVSKKEFCRLIKGATLLTPEEVKKRSRFEEPGEPPKLHNQSPNTPS